MIINASLIEPSSALDSSPSWTESLKLAARLQRQRGYSVNPGPLHLRPPGHRLRLVQRRHLATGHTVYVVRSAVHASLYNLCRAKWLPAPEQASLSLVVTTEPKIKCPGRTGRRHEPLQKHGMLTRRRTANN